MINGVQHFLKLAGSGLARGLYVYAEPRRCRLVAGALEGPFRLSSERRVSEMRVGESSGPRRIGKRQPLHGLQHGSLPCVR